MVMLKGNVKPSAIGIYNPGSAFGATNLIAAGTAIYDALAARIEKINLLPTSLVTNALKNAIIHPFIRGIKIEKNTTNHPLFLNAENLLAVVIPISSKKIARNPLKISVVKGFISIACLPFEIYPIIKLPIIINTLPLLTECRSVSFKLIFPFSDLSWRMMSRTPTMIAGNSIKAITATICPPKEIPKNSKNDEAATNVTALTEP